MSPVQLLLHLLAAFGVSYVIGHSRISLPIRNWIGGWVEGGRTVLGKQVAPATEAAAIAKRNTMQHAAAWFLTLVECYACSGFWVGFAYGVATAKGATTTLTYAFAACGSNLLLGLLSGATMTAKQEQDAARLEDALALAESVGAACAAALDGNRGVASATNEEETRQ